MRHIGMEGVVPLCKKEMLTEDNNRVEAVSGSPWMARVSQAKRGLRKFVKLITVYVKGWKRHVRGRFTVYLWVQLWQDQKN